MVHFNKTFSDHMVMGHKALSDGDAALAFECWSICLESLPADPVAYRQLAQSFRAIGHLTQSQQLIQAALTLLPGNHLLLSDLANLHIDQGNPEAAIKALVQLADASLVSGETEAALGFLSNALMALEYSSEATSNTRNQLSEKWGALATSWVNDLAIREQIPAWTPTHAPIHNRQLRIGFKSGDLCDHPVGFLVLPLLQHRSAYMWQPFIYDNGSRQDRTHQQLRSCVDDSNWRLVNHLNDADLMRRILDDQLDILVDLSGHSGKSRLRIMAHRLADTQLSWLGFSATTGLPTINGVILDRYLAQNATPQFCESILTIDPSRFCFRPPFAPPLAQPPCLTNGFVTFGCFNNSAKYNPSLLTLWAQILVQTPGSKLLLKWRTFADPKFCAQTLNTFAVMGIDPTRVTLRGFSPHRQMLDEYNECDIALDTSPFNGGYTSLEALWMGLPLVTLSGDTPISRQSASFLKVLGRASWAAKSPEAYVAIAKTLAGNSDLLVQIRQQQRYQIMDSALYDAAAFTARFESLMMNLTARPIA